MNEYRVAYSYLRGGERITEYDIGMDWTAHEAAQAVRDANADLPGFRIERVWIDTGGAWEIREVD